MEDEKKPIGYRTPGNLFCCEGCAYWMMATYHDRKKLYEEDIKEEQCHHCAQFFKGTKK